MRRILTIEKVTKAFGSGYIKVSALKAIDFYVKEEEFVGIIGPSGSDKSISLTISGGLQIPVPGEIIVNGRSLTELPEKERADLCFKEIGLILQSSNLIPFLTVKEQSELVDQVTSKKEDSTKIDSLLQFLDTQSLKNSYPKDPSGGERQGVATARTLYDESSLVLADEPTASLDTDHVYEVIKLLVKEVHEKQKTTTMVTHNIRMIQWSDRVYRMGDGYLIEEEKKKE